MKIDQKKLNRVLAMSDDQLREMIRQIAEESGIDLSRVGIRTDDLAGLRAALGNATDEDLARYNQLYAEYRMNKKKQP